jgi:hypothetical protein
LFAAGGLTFLVGRLALWDVRNIGWFPGKGAVVGRVLVIRFVIVTRFVIVFALLTFARRTGTGVEDRYRYAGEVEGRYSREAERNLGQNASSNIDP